MGRVDCSAFSMASRRPVSKLWPPPHAHTRDLQRAGDFRIVRPGILHLRSQKAEMAKPAPPAPVKMVMTGLGQAWDSGDNIVRLALLHDMFNGLIIRDGRIMDYEPRPEVAEELDALLVGFLGLDSRRGLCGLRTPDLRLERPAS